MMNIQSSYLYYLISKLYNLAFFFIVSWSDFIISLLAFNSKKIIIYHNSIYHFKTFERKKFNFYIKILSNKFYIIKIDLNSDLMKFILKKFFEIKKIDNKKKFLSNKNIDLNFIKNRISWDKFNKSKISNLNYLLNLQSRRQYLGVFNNFVKNNKASKDFLDASSIFNYEHVKGFLTNEICWDDWVYSNFALKNKKFVIFPDSPQFGFRYYFNDTELQNSKLFKEISNKNFSKTELKQSQTLITKFLSQKNKNHPFYYMRAYKKISNKTFESKHEFAIVYFSNVFVDAPNYGVQNKNFSEYIDYFDNFLFVLEHCVKYKIPLYIKLHPLSFKYLERNKFSHEYYYYNCMIRIVNEIKKNNQSYIELIDGSLPNKIFKNLKKPIALTARSNVSIEMGFLGIPCFTFFDNYWKRFSFAKKIKKLPRNKKEINKIYNYFDKDLSKKEAIKVYSFLIEKNKKNIFSIKNFDGEIASINKKNINEINSIVNKLHFLK